MRKVAFLLLALVACSHSPFPPANFAPLPPALAQTPAGAVIVERQLTLDYALDGNNERPIAHLTERVRVRITGPAGASFARWPVPHGPHVAVTRAQARLTHAEGDAVDAQVVENQLVLPAPKAGDLIDVALVYTHDLPEVLPALMAADRAPTVLWHLAVRAQPGCIVRVASGTDAGATLMLPTSPGTHPLWDVTMHNLDAREPSVPAASPGPFVVAVLNGYELPDGTIKDVASSWDAVAAWVAELGSQSAPKDESALRSLRQGVGRAQALRIQEALKPKVTASLFDILPRPYEALKGGGATVLEASSVAVAVSAPSLEPARLTLVAPAANFPVLDALPGLYAFTDAMLAVQGEGNAWQFMDLMCTTCRPGEVEFERVGGRALVVAPKRADLVRVPLSAAQPNRRRMQFDWTLNVDGTLSGTLLAELEGASEAPVRRALHAKDLAPEARLGAVQHALWGEGPKPTGDASEVTRPYGVRMQINAVSSSNDQALRLSPKALAGEGFIWRLPATGDVVLPGPLESETVCTVVLPNVRSITLPEAVNLAGHWGSYSAHFEMQEHYMVYTQSLRLAARLMSDAERADLAVAVAKIAAAQARAVVVYLED